MEKKKQNYTPCLVSQLVINHTYQILMACDE